MSFLKYNLVFFDRGKFHPLLAFFVVLSQLSPCIHRHASSRIFLFLQCLFVLYVDPRLELNFIFDLSKTLLPHSLLSLHLGLTKTRVQFLSKLNHIPPGLFCFDVEGRHFFSLLTALFAKLRNGHHLFFQVFFLRPTHAIDKRVGTVAC